MIDSFKGPHSWLSNFATCTVMLDGIRYSSVENAFQAAKTLDPDERKPFTSCSAATAKQLGKRVTLRSDWLDMRQSIMYNLCNQKFEQEPYRSRLLSTGNQELVEGNWWNDTFWGVCRGKGSNHLGKIIMQIRSRLKEM